MFWAQVVPGSRASGTPRTHPSTPHPSNTGPEAPSIPSIPAFHSIASRSCQGPPSSPRRFLPFDIDHAAPPPFAWGRGTPHCSQFGYPLPLRFFDFTPFEADLTRESVSSSPLPSILQFSGTSLGLVHFLLRPPAIPDHASQLSPQTSWQSSYSETSSLTIYRGLGGLIFFDGLLLARR